MKGVSAMPNTNAPKREIEITPSMLDAAEAELQAHLAGELGSNFPFARPIAEAVLKAALELAGPQARFSAQPEPSQSRP